MENRRMVGMAMKYYKIIITTDKLDYKFVDFVAVDNYRKL